MTKRILPILTLFTAFTLTGCTAAFDPPAGYIRDKNDNRYDLKAVSSRGHVIALKSRPNEDKNAGLPFWNDAIEHQKVDIDGMKLAARDSIKTARGLDGTLFRFEIGEGQSRITYLVALFVTPTTIYTIEATGPAAKLEEELPALKKSIESLKA